MSGSVIPCVGAVIKDARGRLLLIKRGHAPGAGLWSLPGGRIEPGETDAQALVREMREETGLLVEPGALIGTVRRPAGDGDVFDIADYAATASHMSALLGRLRAQGRRLPVDVDAHSELLGTPVEAIGAVVDRLTGWPGGPAAWVTEHGGSDGDLRRWRDRLAGGDNS